MGRFLYEEENLSLRKIMNIKGFLAKVNSKINITKMINIFLTTLRM